MDASKDACNTEYIQVLDKTSFRDASSIDMQRPDIQKGIAHRGRNSLVIRAEASNAGSLRKEFLGTDEYWGLEFWNLYGFPFALTKEEVQQALEKQVENRSG